MKPTVLDITRAVSALNAVYEKLYKDNALPAADIYDAEKRVADNLAFVCAELVALNKVSTRDVRLMLIAHGASRDTAHNSSRGIARLLRSDIASHRWGGALA